MPRVKQLTVRCENRPGTLAQIAAVLGEVNVNISGVLAHNVRDQSLRETDSR